MKSRTDSRTLETRARSRRRREHHRTQLRAPRPSTRADVRPLPSPPDRGDVVWQALWTHEGIEGL